MLVLHNTSAYGFGVTSRLPFNIAIERVKEAFEIEGFGVVSQIDMRDTLCKKLGESIAPYTIVGFCDPRAALHALREETEAGLLFPCNVLVRTDQQGTVHVSVMNPYLLIRLTENNRLRGLSDELFAGIERALERFAREAVVDSIAA